MKRLMWLSTPVREHMLSEWFAEQNIVHHYYNLEQMTSLTSFAHRARSLAEQNYILIDLEHSTYQKEQIAEAVQMLRRLTAARQIFIVPEQDKELQLMLASEEVVSVIIVRQSTDVAAELRQCIAGEGSGFAGRAAVLQNGMAARAKEQVQTLIIPQSLQLHCAVAGTMQRIGTTTQAFALCRYLSALGFRPLLVVDESNRLLDTLQLAYPDKIAVHCDYIEIDGLCMSTSTCDRQDFNARVFDVGVLNESTAQIIRDTNVHLRLLVSGIKPWELQSFAAAKGLLQDVEHRACVSFGDEDELARLQRYFGERTVLAPWNPMPLIPCDLTPYDTLFLSMLQELCHA